MAELLSSRRTRFALADERGFGIPTALFVSLIVFALGGLWSQLGVHNMQASTHDRAREQALHAAESGVNHAMSELTLDPEYAGGQGSAPGTGDWDVTVTKVNPGDPADLRRVITGSGFVPDRSDPSPVQRRLQVEVELENIDGFDFALFAGAGVLTGDNYMTVDGDLYGLAGIDLKSHTDVRGDVVTPEWVKTSNQSLIGGDIHAGGDVTLENSTTTVQGNVYSGGNVHVNARVVGDVQAKGSVTFGSFGSVDGNVVEGSAPPSPRQESLPEYTWDPDNFSPEPATAWTSASAFSDAWNTQVSSGQPFSYHHRICSGTDCGDTGPIELNKKWDMGADVTIVSDGKITLSREVGSDISETLDLVIISFSEEGIALTNNVTIPDNIRVLLFAPNGPIDFRNLKHFRGAVFGESVNVDQNFTLNWAEPEAPGFDFTLSSPVHYRVTMQVFREVASTG